MNLDWFAQQQSTGPAVVTMSKDTVCRNGYLQGVVSGLAGISGPVHLRYACVERCVKLGFPYQAQVSLAGLDTPAVCANTVASTVIALHRDANGFAPFSFQAFDSTPPNFIAVQDCLDHTLVYIISHIVTVCASDGLVLGRASVNVIPPPTEAQVHLENLHMDKELRVLPRIRWRCVSHKN
jgi:hypothetical protein